MASLKNKKQTKLQKNTTPNPVIESKPSIFSKLSSKPEILFLVLSLLFGLLFGITTPPFQIPDESVHFGRAYQLSTLKVSMSSNGEYYGDSLPSNFDVAALKFSYLAFNPRNKVKSDSIDKAFEIPVNTSEKKFTYNSAGNYSYLNYIPQLVGVYIARISDAGVLKMLYIGRIMALLFFIVCTYWAIKNAPIGKFSLLLLSLTPISLSLVTSFSPDSMNITVAILSVSLFLQLYFTNEIALTNKKLILLALATLSIGVMKPIYIPFTLLLFILPIKNFTTKSTYWIVSIVTFLLTITLTYVWLKIVNSYINDPSVQQTQGTNSSVQLMNVIKNPLQFIKTIATTIRYYGAFYVQSYIGILGYLDTKLPNWIYKTYYFLIPCVILLDNNKNYSLSKTTKILLFGIALGICIATFLAMHIYGVLNSPVIDGIQGRYFIPAIFILALALNNLFNLKNELLQKTFVTLILFILVLILLLNSELTLYARYFLTHR